MTILQAIILGIIQGLTEFIPVSSTAHLLIFQKLMAIPYSDALFSFLVIVQLGTLVSLVIEYRHDLISILRAVIRYKQPTEERNLGFFLILATIPALIAGYLLKDLVEILFKTPFLEASIRLITAALVLFLAERISKKDRDLDRMTWLDALIIGLFQVIAIFPGASRSGVTISAGLFRNFDRKAAARFAFLLSIPVMSAAGGFELIEVLKTPGLDRILFPLVVGFITAALVGWLAIRWLLNFLAKHALNGFMIYCSILGISALIIHLLG